jgi:hypothetical protein
MKPLLFLTHIAVSLACVMVVDSQQRQAFAATQRSTALIKPLSSDLFSGYQDDTGAMTVTRKGDFADPYFAMKALWVMGYGKTTPPEPKEQEVALRLMKWMLPLQLPNGSFERYCKASNHNTGTSWKTCKAADADDVMTALWVYCVLRYAPPDDPAWNASAARSLTLLATLWDEGRNVFRLFPNNQEALFIDNLELFELLPSISNPVALKRLFPNAAEAAKSPALSLFQNGISNKLKNGIEKTFEIKLTTQTYPKRLASPGQLPGLNFYPHVVAPIFIWTSTIQSKITAQRLWAQWWELAGNAWLKRETDNYPWAIIALVAYKLDPMALNLWLTAACKQRDDPLWTVMDEAVWLRLDNSTQCAGGAK